MVFTPNQFTPLCPHVDTVVPVGGGGVYLDSGALDPLQLVLDVTQLLLLPLDVGLDQPGPLLQLLLQVLHGAHLRNTRGTRPGLYRAFILNCI